KYFSMSRSAGARLIPSKGIAEDADRAIWDVAGEISAAGLAKVRRDLSSRAAQTARDLGSALTLTRCIECTHQLRAAFLCGRNLWLRGPSASARFGMTASRTVYFSDCFKSASSS